MTRQQNMLLGVAAAATAAITGGWVARKRHGISFAGRHVIITGGSRGLGLVLARRLSAEGAHVCLLARDEGELERARGQLEQARLRQGVGGVGFHERADQESAPEIITMRCDVRRRADVHATMDKLMETWVGVDVLINNAGTIQVGPLEHMKHEDFENAMATHFWASLHFIQACLPAMRRRRFGRIVNISSVGGRVGVPHLAPYCASKFALCGLSDSIRAELSRYGIRVTTVCPSLMRTGSPRNASIKGQHEAEYAWFAIADGLPGLSVSAENAAHQIIEACRYGDPDLTIGLPAKVAIWANALAPTAVALAMMAVAKALPGPNGSEGDRQRKGHESESRWAPSVATALSDRAAVMNNEL